MKKNKKKRLLALAAACVVLVLFGVLAFAGNFLVTYAIGRSGDGANRQVALEVDQKAVSAVEGARSEHADAQRVRTLSFYENVPEETVQIKSDDGLTLNGGYYANGDSHHWALLIHGYRGNHYGMLGYAERYWSNGWQVLAPDMRACGDSEGEYVGMGWPDRLDVLRWIDWVLAKDPQAQIALHGVSMGGATVLMTSGEPTPDAVIAFVEDCGYTSVWDIFSSELSLRFHLPEFPVLYSASAISGLRAGYTFEQASSLRQVAKCEKPMLFIHGDQDNFVPFTMLQPLYDAKPGDNKQMLAVTGAGHGQASSVLGDDYWAAVFSFLGNYLSE